MCFHHGDLTHALLRCLDFLRQLMVMVCSPGGFGGEIGVIQKAMFRQIVERLRHLFEVEGPGPPRITSTLPSLEFCLNIHQQIHLRRICMVDIFRDLRVRFFPARTAIREGIL